jgi:phenylpyruvate tautomerase PptA (4-oxalocrotonate tautomerase family)
MPYFTLSTSLSLTDAEKATTITAITNSVLVVAPTMPVDKIQVTVSPKSKADLGRGGQSLVSGDFSTKSRIVSNESKESYYKLENHLEDLAIVEVDPWDILTRKQKQGISSQITKHLKEKYYLSGDNVLIIFRDMPAGNWFQNGIAGDDENFLNDSRKYE